MIKISNQLRYYHKHKKQINAKKKKYRDKHKKEYNEYIQNWREKNKKSFLKYRTKYNKIYKRTPSGIYNVLKDRCNQKQISLSFTKIEFINWYKSQIQQCYYCKRTLQRIKNDKKEKIKNRKKRLSIDRPNNNKGYSLNNIVLSCYRCNTTKSDYFTKKEMLKIAKTLYKKGE